MIVKFDTNEEYWRWFEKKQEEKVVNDYFMEVEENG